MGLQSPAKNVLDIMQASRASFHRGWKLSGKAVSDLLPGDSSEDQGLVAMEERLGPGGWGSSAPCC